MGNQSALAKSQRKLGIWLIGASGNVATTVAVGLAALQKKLTPPIGLVTDQAPLAKLLLAPLSNITLGGHEISRRSVAQSADELRRNSGIFDELMLRAVKPALAKYEKNIRTGTAIRCGHAISRLATRSGARKKTSARHIIGQLRNDLRLFRRRHRLHRVVVVHVASTEPAYKLTATHRNWSKLDKALSQRTSPLPASSLYAVAAIEENMPFVSFTPSLGVEVPAIHELAEMQGVPFMCSDPKTGETLLKTVLAPMFRERHLKIESWVGHNVLGNGDGMVLDSSPNKAAKLETKNGVIASLVGYPPQTRTSIEYVESLHDWKTAWDHVHFRGFLGTKMSLQFVWQGCDSILAAPLIIDLARLADYHAEQGHTGVMKHLACFFKSPMGVSEHGFAAQVEMLHRYVAGETSKNQNVKKSKHRSVEKSKRLNGKKSKRQNDEKLRRQNKKSKRRKVEKTQR